MKTNQSRHAKKHFPAEAKTKIHGSAKQCAMAIAVLSILMLLFTLGCAQQTAQQSKNAPENKQSEKPGGANETIHFKFRAIDSEGTAAIEKEITAKKGQTLFEALSEVENGISFGYREYAYGTFITAIGKVVPSNGEYLAIYVDGKYAEKGATDLKPENGSTIEFKVEKIS